jgi:hypothetical protein
MRLLPRRLAMPVDPKRDGEIGIQGGHGQDKEELDVRHQPGLGA